MPEVIGIKFKTSPKMYFYGPAGVRYAKGDNVIVDSPKGLEIATVIMPNTEKDHKEIIGELKDVTRKATDKDFEAEKSNAAKAKEVLPVIKEAVSASGLDMHVSKVEISHDGAKCIVNFTSDGRVDFRDLVRDIATRLKLRIELRQIGARDECRALGGLGPCGRACCCSDYIPEYPQTSIKMAKNQGLSLNPAKVSGLCGRLMCCLSYENEHYCEVNRRCPKIGGKCKMKCGTEGTLTQINQLKETIKVKVDNKDREGFEIKEYNIDDLV